MNKPRYRYKNPVHSFDMSPRFGLSEREGHMAADRAFLLYRRAVKAAAHRRANRNKSLNDWGTCSGLCALLPDRIL